VAVFLLLAGTGSYLFGFSSIASQILWAGVLLLSILIVDRAAFALSVIKKQRDFLSVFLPSVHLLRNLVWSWALLMWMMKGIRRKS
jgi:hypothetical protein